MLMKLLVPDIAVIADRSVRSELSEQAMRMFGFTASRGFLLGGVMVLPTFVLAMSLNSGGFRLVRSLTGVVVIFVIMCAMAQAFLVFTKMHAIQGQIRMAMRECGVPMCFNCGYNLTGNTSKICPECGTTAGEFVPIDTINTR